jgi:hypothetical protein
MADAAIKSKQTKQTIGATIKMLETSAYGLQTISDASRMLQPTTTMTGSHQLIWLWSTIFI